jgi:hypothetical protein
MTRRVLVLLLGALPCGFLFACPLSLDEYGTEWRPCLPDCGTSVADASSDGDAPDRAERADDSDAMQMQEASEASSTDACPDVVPSFVQRAYVSTGFEAGLAVTAAFGGAQQACDLNIVVVSWNDVTHNVAHVTDTSLNPYEPAGAPTMNTTTGQPLTQVIYYAHGIAAADSNAVTVNFGGTGWVPFVDVRLLEYQGLDPKASYDVVASGVGLFDGSPGDASVASTSPSASTSFAHELVVGAGTTTWDFTDAGVGFTLRVYTHAGNVVEDKFLSSSGPQVATAPMALHSQSWIMQLATFH